MINRETLIHLSIHPYCLPQSAGPFYELKNLKGFKKYCPVCFYFIQLVLKSTCICILVGRYCLTHSCFGIHLKLNETFTCFNKKENIFISAASDQIRSITNIEFADNQCPMYRLIRLLSGLKDHQGINSKFRHCIIINDTIKVISFL